MKKLGKKTESTMSTVLAYRACSSCPQKFCGICGCGASYQTESLSSTVSAATSPPQVSSATNLCTNVIYGANRILDIG